MPAAFRHLDREEGWCKGSRIVAGCVPGGALGRQLILREASRPAAESRGWWGGDARRHPGCGDGALRKARFRRHHGQDDRRRRGRGNGAHLPRLRRQARSARGVDRRAHGAAAAESDHRRDRRHRSTAGCRRAADEGRPQRLPHGQALRSHAAHHGARGTPTGIRSRTQGSRPPARLRRFRERPGPGGGSTCRERRRPCRCPQLRHRRWPAGSDGSPRLRGRSRPLRPRDRHATAAEATVRAGRRPCRRCC